MKRNKRGLSPVIATVLLISIVLVIALIVFLWFKGMVQESITKFGKNIELVCEEVQMDASYSDKLYVRNLGNVYIYNLKAKIYTDKGHETIDLDTLDTGSFQGLPPAGTWSYSPDGTLKKIILIPVLYGLDSDGEKGTYVCNERHGVEITI